MVYHIIRDEILLIALNYPRSFRARKNTKELVKYLRVLYFKSSKYVNAGILWNPNLIEIWGRGVKIITLLLDHNLSYKDNTYYEKLLCSTWSIAFLIYVGETVHL